MTLTAWHNFLKAKVRLSEKIKDSEWLAPLPNFAVIEIAGADAVDFLHGQFTTAIKTLDLKACQVSAWCNAKGQTYATFLIRRTAQDRFTIILPATLQTSFIERLRRYILRADVQITDLSDAHVIIGAATVDHTLLTKSDCLLLPTDPNRYLMIDTIDRQIERWQSFSQILTPLPTTTWQLHDIQNKLAWLTPATSEKFLPQMLGLDRIHAADYHKGCYPGQEIIARLHFRGTLKRCLHIASCKTNTPPACGDTLVTKDRSSAGKVINVAPMDDTYCLLAVIDNDALNAPLFIGDINDGVQVNLST